MPLSQNVGTFKMRKSLSQTVVGQSTLGVLHLGVKSGL